MSYAGLFLYVCLVCSSVCFITFITLAAISLLLFCLLSYGEYRLLLLMRLVLLKCETFNQAIFSNVGCHIVPKSIDSYAAVIAPIMPASVTTPSSISSSSTSPIASAVSPEYSRMHIID